MEEYRRNLEYRRERERREALERKIYGEFGSFAEDVQKIPKADTLVNSEGLERREGNLNKKVYQITAHDFVVRRGVLKCRNRNHTLEDIQAEITTINRQGIVSQVMVPAGYCSDCNIYFIMDNIFQRIKHSGIPICRTMDERTYISGIQGKEGFGKPGSSYDKLAQESVLRQFGYTVSQTEDLSVDQRRHILAAIVDYKVLTKNEIISYLEYFINNRKNQRNRNGSFKYGQAIDRWRDDRDWISNYKMGSFKVVTVKRIISNTQ